MCTSGTPAAYRSRARSSASASPPRFNRRIDPGRAPSPSSSRAALGTMLACITPASAGSSASDRAFSTSTSVAPLASAWCTSATCTSNDTEVAPSTRSPGARGNAASIHSRNAATAACGIITPFGFPVEPEV